MLLRHFTLEHVDRLSSALFSIAASVIQAVYVFLSGILAFLLTSQTISVDSTDVVSGAYYTFLVQY